jgi:threonylcarbamoyladenosine tRNA methylthiotransferase MtaB
MTDCVRDSHRGIIPIFMKKKFVIATLGCRTNQYESQGFADQLKKMGYEAAKEGEKADLCIVNTCTVTESADSSSRHQIRSLLKKHPGAKVAVTGCMVESKGQDILAIDEKLKLVPNQKKELLIQEIFPDLEEYPEFKIETFDAHTRAFVKVQDGCNSFCTYCIIPYVRGRSRSRQIPDVVEEAKGLVARGYKEIVITGINVGDFDGGGTLADLVREIDCVEGLKRLRISSIDPDEIDENLASAVMDGKTTAPSMHIVLQSGSNVILKRMNRKYTRQMFFETFDWMKKKNPDFTATTDIIVGFPGETEDDFEETVDAIRRARFAKVHMFPYSPRKRTRAALYPNRLSPDVVKKRKAHLMRVAEESAFSLRELFLGRTMDVLLESMEDGGWISGHTPNFLRVKLEKKNFRPNDIVSVQLIENGPDGLVGKIV